MIVIGSGRQDGTRSDRQHLLAGSGSAVAVLYFGGVGVKKDIDTALKYLKWAGMSETNHLPTEHNAFIRRVLLAIDTWANSWD